MTPKQTYAFTLCMSFFLFGCGLLTAAFEPLPTLTPTSPASDRSERDNHEPTVQPASTILQQPAETASPNETGEGEQANPPSPDDSEPEKPVNTLPASIGPVVTPTFYLAEYTDTSLQLKTFDTF